MNTRIQFADASTDFARDQSVDPAWYSETVEWSKRPQKLVHWQARTYPGLFDIGDGVALKVVDKYSETLHVFTAETRQLAELIAAYNYLYQGREITSASRRSEPVLAPTSLARSLTSETTSDTRDKSVRISTILIRGGSLCLNLAGFSLLYWLLFNQVLVNVFLSFLVVVGAPFFIWMGHIIRSQNGYAERNSSNRAKRS